MSGVSVAVRGGETNRGREQAVMGGVMGSLRVIELQLVAFIMVFSITGLVPLLDLIFPALATGYLLALSRLAFPTRGHASTSEEIFEGGSVFRAYVVVGTSVGLFLPLAYVLGGFARGDDTAVRSATPHLFLLSFQILSENVVSAFYLFSPPVRALLPLLYTLRRVFVILDWNTRVWSHQTPPHANNRKDVAWCWFGRYLAVANLVYFSINLFGFLIPKFLPKAFEMYFRDRDDELHAKMSQHNRSQPADNKDD